VVIVNDPAQDVAATDGSRGRPVFLARHRGGHVKASVGTGLVGVADILGKHGLEMGPGDNEEVVEAVLADRAHPAFGERVVTSRQLQLMMKI
jgi:hypothetical protein